jgi:hypothetical protein
LGFTQDAGRPESTIGINPPNLRCTSTSVKLKLVHDLKRAKNRSEFKLRGRLMKNKTYFLCFLVLIVSACSGPQQVVRTEPKALSDKQICKEYLARETEIFAKESVKDNKLKSYLERLQREFFARGLTELKCEKLTKNKLY